MNNDHATRDVFLCHASEEKSAVVRPLVAELQAEGISVWFDEAEMRWGDSITEKVNEGLRVSRYVIVVLSKVFLDKKWPQRELNAALQQEASTGQVRVLPLLVGGDADRQAILAAYPLMADKLFLPWDADTQTVVSALSRRLQSDAPQSDQSEAQGSAGPARAIPLPKNRRPLTQRDKDRFLREAFGVVRDYFTEGVRQLSESANGIEADVDEIHKYKFVCSFYRNGDIVTRCKIWIGAPMSSASIAYADGPHLDVDSDSSRNDWLSVEDEGPELCFRTSGLAFGAAAGGSLDAEKAAEYLWRRATERLDRT